MFASLLGIALAVAPAAPVPPPQAAAGPPPTIEEVFAIPPPLREALHEQVIVPGGNSDQQRLTRLMRFLFDPAGLGMTYQHDADHTVAQAWQTRQANCLAFTLLTVALAREAGINAFGQEIPRVLTWYREGDALYFSNHVNAGMRAGGQRYTIDVASDSILSGEPPRQIDDTRLLAILYTNRAAGLLGRGRHAQAGEYMAAAFQADDTYPAAWNNAGVLALRALPRRTDGSRGPREWLLALLHSRVGRILATPLVAAVHVVASIALLYLTPVYGLVLTSTVAQLLTVLHLSVVGYLFTNAIIGTDPGPRRPHHGVRLVLLLPSICFYAFFGLALLSSTTVRHPGYYERLALPWLDDPLADQQVGGALVWALGELPALGMALLIALRQCQGKKGQRAAGQETLPRSEGMGQGGAHAANQRFLAVVPFAGTEPTVLAHR